MQILRECRRVRNKRREFLGKSDGRTRLSTEVSNSLKQLSPSVISGKGGRTSFQSSSAQNTRKHLHEPVTGPVAIYKATWSCIQQRSYIDPVVRNSRFTGTRVLVIGTCDRQTRSRHTFRNGGPRPSKKSIVNGYKNYLNN